MQVPSFVCSESKLDIEPSDLEIPTSAILQLAAYYAGIKISNNLPTDLKSLKNEKARFKITLKRYLNTHSFCSVDEYLLSKKLLIHVV
jgi:hypothetical protein